MQASVLLFRWGSYCWACNLLVLIIYLFFPSCYVALCVKVYFPEGSGEAIVDHLGAHLPMEEVKLDLLDKIVNFLRI